MDVVSSSSLCRGAPSAGCASPLPPAVFSGVVVIAAARSFRRLSRPAWSLRMRSRHRSSFVSCGSVSSSSSAGLLPLVLFALRASLLAFSTASTFRRSASHLSRAFKSIVRSGLCARSGILLANTGRAGIASVVECSDARRNRRPAFLACLRSYLNMDVVRQGRLRSGAGQPKVRQNLQSSFERKSGLSCQFVSFCCSVFVCKREEASPTYVKSYPSLVPWDTVEVS